MMGDDKRIQVPYFRPSIGEAEIAEVVACLRSGWLTTGPRTKQFEMIFARAGRRKTRGGRELRHRSSASGRRCPRPGTGSGGVGADDDVRRHRRGRALPGRRSALGRLRPRDDEHGPRRRRTEDRTTPHRPDAVGTGTARRGDHSGACRRADDGHGPGPEICRQARSVGDRGRRAQLSRRVSGTRLAPCERGRGQWRRGNDTPLSLWERGRG